MMAKINTQFLDTLADCYSFLLTRRQQRLAKIAEASRLSDSNQRQSITAQEKQLDDDQNQKNIDLLV